jgi:translocation and assembly module TamB
MSDETDIPPDAPPRRRRWLRWLALVLAGLVVAIGLALLVLDSPVGHRFVAGRIGALAPASGLRITVGQIDGSIYGKAQLRDVSLADPQGTFATLPDARLDWRPLHWFTSGLDIRALTLRGGALLRLPKLRPGDPDSPILPDFDIRIDRLDIEQLTVPSGVLGAARRVDMTARADIRSGRALINATGSLGGEDRLLAVLDAEPDKDRFDLKLDVNAPKGGLIAGLSGLPGSMRLQADGIGSWKSWDGHLLGDQDGARFAALKLSNRAGRYGVSGQVWPNGMLTGLLGRGAGEVVAIKANGTLESKVLQGESTLVGQSLSVNARGAVDLTGNLFDSVKLDAQLRDPEKLIPGVRLENASLTAMLDGPFRDLEIDHTLTVGRAISGSTQIEALRQTGIARYDGSRWTLPLDASAARVTTGNTAIDPRLVQPGLKGTVTLTGSSISSDNLALQVPGIATQLALRGDIARGGYALAGPIMARALTLNNLGTTDAAGRIVVSFGNAPWRLKADLDGRLVRADNPTLTSLVGSGISYSGRLLIGSGQPLSFEQVALRGSKLSLALSGRMLPGGGSQLAGRGSHIQYGPFTVEGRIAQDGPRATLVFANPLPAAGLSDVRVALAPIAGGFQIDAQGGSKLGAFSGAFGLFAKGGSQRVEVRRLDVWKTAVTGALTFNNGVASGKLNLAGGGISGTIDLAPQGGGQGFVANLLAQGAQFGGDVPLSIDSAQLTAQGSLINGHTSLSGYLTAQGIGQGRLFLGRVAANARLTDGAGQITASLAGRRGNRFDLQLLADLTPGRIALSSQGQFAGQRIVMPRRAVLTAEQGGWRLAPTQLDFAGGRVIASGLVSAQAADMRLALSSMPLSVIDLLKADLGLGGRISGLVDYRQPARGAATGEFKVKISGLTRSGLVLTSRPIDLALVGALMADRLETRAVASEAGQVRGRLQGHITGLAGSGSLAEKIQRGALFAQLRYNGPADALWRLAALESFDLSGPLTVAADVTGSLASPSIRGSLAGAGLQLQSSLIGTQVSGLSVKGAFAGSQLVVSSLSGQTLGGGTITGSGSFDFAGLGERNPAIDLRLAARGARVLAREDMAATVTGPLLIRSDGASGVIAGRLALDRASWRLGRATAAQQLPDIRTREINRASDGPALRAAAAPWRLLIDAKGASRVDVRGLGLDSEWGADIQLRGTTAATIINGRADLVRGGYEFAGKRFEMTRGRITFVGSSPPDPRLDILAEDRESGLTARISVTGTSLYPVIAFSSIPALPEEELLSRMLFGTSITNISAPEALQLGAAIASLRGGGGLDPINRLRQAIGLDRLRIVSADVSVGRGTGIAAGKFLTRRLYAEVVTDGRGYSATQLEFRVSNWLSLLSAISTAGRESINARVSKDY